MMGKSTFPATGGLPLKRAGRIGLLWHEFRQPCKRMPQWVFMYFIVSAVTGTLLLGAAILPGSWGWVERWSSWQQAPACVLAAVLLLWFARAIFHGYGWVRFVLLLHPLMLLGAMDVPMFLIGIALTGLMAWYLFRKPNVAAYFARDKA